MHRRHILGLALGLALGASAAHADPATLTAAEIDALLSGNTAVGDWNGTPYRQWFAENGITVYVPKGGRPDRGKWRVNPETDDYESWWEQSGWSRYGIARAGDTLLWVETSGKTHPFAVLEGNQSGE